MAIVFKVKPWYRKGGNPDDYFDPVTHIATEENFIKFLDCGVYDSKYIGYGVTLGNSYENDGGLWKIIDVNHDSSNTLQTDCYDLMSTEVVLKINDAQINWASSTTRSKLNGDFYNGFSSAFKNRIMPLVYNYRMNWQSDYLINPSNTELTGADSYYGREGKLYEALNNDYKRKMDDTYRTRTPYEPQSYYQFLYVVYTNGGVGYKNITNSADRTGSAPIMRVQ